MNPGTLNCRVTIKQPSTAQDELGQPTDAWTTLDTVWADVRYERGLEAIRANRETSSAQVSVRIYRRLDVTAAMRVEYGSTVFQIKTVLQDHALKQFTDLVCEVIDG